MNPTSIVLPTTHSRETTPAHLPASKKKSGRRAPGESNHNAGQSGVAPDTHPKPPSGAAGVRHESAPDSTEETVFHVEAIAAGEVLLAGDFTNWKKSPIRLTKGGGGVWHVKVPLHPGRHEYRFLVDGQWQDDQNRPERAPNPFGTSNSVVVIK